MTRIAPAFLLALSMTLLGCAAEDMEPADPGGGKADSVEDTGSQALSTVAFRSTPMAALPDPGCENCDAIGFAMASVDVPAPVSGDVLIKAVVRHSSPEDLRAFIDLNSDRNFFDPIRDGHWDEDISVQDDDAMVHSISLAADREGCVITAEHPQCFDIRFVASMGVMDMDIFEDGEAARWDFSVMDLALNGATGQLRELSVIIVDPSAPSAL